MGTKRELVWRVLGTVYTAEFNVGKKEKPYWQVLVEVDNGYVCAYVRSESLRPIAECLIKGDLVEMTGTIKPRKLPNESKGPVWLDPVEQIRKIV